MNKITLLLSCLLFVHVAISQESIVKNVKFKSIGPSVMSGRVVDLDVNPKNPNEFYVAYASGGLWHTINNGTSFEPISDNGPTQNIGDIAIDWKNDIIWVGTGESNSSRSSYSGIGLLKSVDKGASWQLMGLPDSHHIGRIMINDNNPNEVVVGVIGHLYTPNAERGVFKTSDGGKTWRKTLFIDENTGIIDIATVPNNFNIMFAAAWQRDRKAWNFKGSGEKSGIYKSIDGGESWKIISNKNSGFPTGEGVGRIGISVFDESTIYSVVDNQFRREKEDDKDKKKGALKKEDFEKMSQSDFMKLEEDKLNTYLKDNNFPKKYNAKKVKSLVESSKIKPSDFYNYLKDANSDLFDTPVIGAQVYRSNDGGKTWKRTHKKYIDDLYYSYGYYFGMIHVHPKNKDKIYIYGVPILSSSDGGQNFKSIGKENVHADHHALWINPNLPGHLIDGNDGGVNISYDDGETWIKNNQPEVGQFYTVNVDNATPYNVYGGLQDNGVWKGPSNNEESKSWQQSGQYPFESLMGGDGMQVEIDNRNDSIIYTGYQFGYYSRINLIKNKRKGIRPKHDLGESPYRFNWQTPILLSSHNQDILYLGSNKLHRSMKRGDDFEVISGDLTKESKKGNVPFGTLTAIAESNFQFGLLYTGSDDGLVQLSKNGGESWTRISGNLPQNLWVSRVIASQHKKERVYVTLNGYRNDDFKPYVFVSDNYGTTWKSIGSNLNDSPINVIKEDPEDENILYLGNDQGVYISFDRGLHWMILENGLPRVAVHDLVIQNTAKEMVIGTHGRSIYIVDIESIQKFGKAKNNELTIFEIGDIKYSKSWGNSWSTWAEPNEPTLEIPFYVASGGSKTIQIKSENGLLLNSFKVEAEEGFNFEEYDLTFSEKGLKDYKKEFKDIEINEKKNGKNYLPKGKYQVVIDEINQSFNIM